MRYKYTKKEEDIIKDNLVILVDTKEQENSHILSVFDKRKILYKKMNLEQGDYSIMLKSTNETKELGVIRDIYFDKDFVVERKNSIDEVCGNFTVDRASRLKKEFSTLKANKTKVYFFIENPDLNKSLNTSETFKGLSVSEKENMLKIIQELDLRPSFDYDLRKHRFISKFEPNKFNRRLKFFITRYNLNFKPVFKELMWSEIKETLEIEALEILKNKGFIEEVEKEIT